MPRQEGLLACVDQAASVAYWDIPVPGAAPPSARFTPAHRPALRSAFHSVMLQTEFRNDFSESSLGFRVQGFLEQSVYDRFHSIPPIGRVVCFAEMDQEFG